MTETELNEQIAAAFPTEDYDNRQTEKRRRRMRRQVSIQKNDAIMRITHYGGYAPHRGYIDWGFYGKTLLHSGKYIKYPKNSKYQKRGKKATSRKMRDCPITPAKGNYYRRLFDYWWVLY